MQNNFSIQPKRFLFLLAAVAVVVFILIFSTLNEANPGFSNDRQKRVDLMNIHGAIIQTSFIKKQNILEYLPVGCSDIELLRTVVIDDWFNEARGEYTIGTSADKREFVLRTEIENEDDFALLLEDTEDVDGIVFGCDCNDPYYCFKTDLSDHLNDTN